MTYTVRKAIITAAVSGVCVACGIPTETSKVVQLHFEGIVTHDNKPLEGATVEVNGSLFVWTIPTASTTTDANGKYTVQSPYNCDEGADLNLSPGNSAMLVAHAVGYGSVSSVNIGRTLICTEAVQRVDFAL
ncbi:MAG TPA: hypothetical protein VFD22_08315 [Gemmatimonadaceae bacterium]|nr:hypothetical protein [Gemmatimonadaceae bacterium]